MFAQFQDDTYDTTSSIWTKNQQPSYFSTFIDANVNNPSSNGNLSHFYRKMSFDKFKLVGDPYFVITQHPQSYYNDFTTYGILSNANREILQTLDSQVNFALYDNWTFDHSGNFLHAANTPDGNVDMVIILWRQISVPAYTTGIAILGFGSSFNLDGKTIQYGFPGSGLTNGGGVFGPVVVSIKHELGHYLFGGGHPTHGNVSDPYGFWGIMTSGPQITGTAHEKYLMRWINFNEISSGTSYGVLGDFVTQGAAARIKIPGTSQAYIIENHQKLDPYFDDPNYIWPGKGLFIYRINDTAAWHPNYNIMSADGDFNWLNPYWMNHPWSDNPLDSIPVFRKLDANRNGYDGRDGIPHSKGGLFRIFALDNNGQPWVHERLWGDLVDAYNINFNQVFSPWSNPVAKKGDGTLSSIAVEITGKSTGFNGEDIFNLTYYNGNAIDASPSKPVNVAISVYTGGGEWNPKITWTAMSEPDVTSGGSIYVERSKKLATGYWTAWSTIATLAGTATQYIDQAFTQSGVGNDSLKYRVRAKDSQNKYSVYSDEAKINFMQIAQKRGGMEKIPTTHALLQNFPNPFNPSTMFRFELPEDEHITLKVFDMLGKEVATVVNGFRQKGYYEEQFEASSLPSGMYVYRLTAGAHSSSKKMMLMK